MILYKLGVSLVEAASVVGRSLLGYCVQIQANSEGFCVLFQGLLGLFTLSI